MTDTIKAQSMSEEAYFGAVAEVKQGLFEEYHKFNEAVFSLSFRVHLEKESGNYSLTKSTFQLSSDSPAVHIQLISV